MYLKGLLISYLLVVQTCLSFAQKDSSRYYFYSGKEYGSEAMYNPFSNVVNCGYDIYQLGGFNREFLSYDYGLATKNVVYNLAHPNESISRVGWWKFTRTELLPLTFTTDGAQWVPNYLLHTMCGGMSYTAMGEWYKLHEVPYPKVFSAITVMSGQFLNEINENTEYVGLNADPIGDVYLFNAGGIILFSFPAVNRFFSEELHMADWSLQPTLTIPDLTLYNTGQYFSLKYDIPKIPKWSIFCRVGMGMMGGLSYKIDNEHALSFGAGVRSGEWVLLDTVGRQQTITTHFSSGIFFDKNNSLLASLIYSNSNDYFLHLNVYPGIIKLGRFSPGLWAVMKKDGTPVFGITSTYFIGLGADL